MEIKFILPPEVRVTKGNPHWKGTLKSGSSGIATELWLVSDTDWQNWSKPVEVDISLYARSINEHNRMPDGHYSKIITWSHEGYSDPGWQERPTP